MNAPISTTTILGKSQLYNNPVLKNNKISTKRLNNPIVKLDFSQLHFVHAWEVFDWRTAALGNQLVEP